MQDLFAASYLPPYRRIYETLDACKAVDYVLFVLSPTTEVDPWDDLLLRSLQPSGYWM